MDAEYQRALQGWGNNTKYTYFSNWRCLVERISIYVCTRFPSHQYSTIKPRMTQLFSLNNKREYPKPKAIEY